MQLCADEIMWSRFAIFRSNRQQHTIDKSSKIGLHREHYHQNYERGGLIGNKVNQNEGNIINDK